ncbi:Nn.00g005550.m01.CDS01 [Neocucurbitaria sp. VM-36]
MAANLEMVSNQLAWALYALSHPRNLHIQAQLRNEIRTNFRNSPETVSWETICSQPYLLGVINEILRLYPNVSHRGRVSNTSTTLQDLPLSKGTILVWPVYAINRDPKHWGPDASEFKPERWFAIEASNEDIPRRDAFAFMTFGQGPRKCPGEQYTRAVMACMLLNLIGRYEFGRVEGHPDVIEEDNGERVAFGIVMKADIWVNVKEVPGWIDTTTAR